MRRISALSVSMLTTAALLSACGEGEDASDDATISAAEESSAEESEDAADESSAEAEASDTESSAEDETSAAEESTSDEAEDPSDEEESADASGPEFGSPVQVSDNMTVTISAPEEFTPSSTDFLSGEWETFVRMDVLVENTGDEPLESFNVYTRATTGSQAAEEVYDYESGLETPSAVIQPGRELEYAIGYGVTAGEPFDLTVEDMMDISSEGTTLSTVIE